MAMSDRRWEAVGRYRTSDSPKDPEDAALIVAADLEGIPPSERTARGAYRSHVLGDHQAYLTFDGRYRCRRVSGTRPWLLERALDR